MQPAAQPVDAGIHFFADRILREDLPRGGRVIHRL